MNFRGFAIMTLGYREVSHFALTHIQIASWFDFQVKPLFGCDCLMLSLPSCKSFLTCLALNSDHKLVYARGRLNRSYGARS